MQTRNLLLVASICGATVFCSAQPGPSASFKQCYGGEKEDAFRTMTLTPDGGYIAAGYSKSSDGDLSSNEGASDDWIVKFNANHSIEWQKEYGGSANDWIRSIACTTDGGYIAAGYSKSSDGDVKNNHGDFDYWILKLDASGNITWQKSMGGSGFENAYSVIQASDGDYVIAGFTESNDGEVAGNHGGQDYWIVKLAGNGDVIWKKTFGGSGNEQAACVIESSDHCYVVNGYATSSDGDVTNAQGGRDFWIIKINSNGQLKWKKCYGGTKDEAGRCIIQTSDGGYLATGYAVSTNGDVNGNHGAQDYWLVKLDSNGALVWQKCYGGSGNDYPYYLEQCADGSLLITGVSTSSGGDISAHYGGEDGWIIKTDSLGNLAWEETFGGTGDEELRFADATSDGSYILGGFTCSIDYDATGNHGSTDGWIIQTCIPPLAEIMNGTSISSCKGTDVTLNAYSSQGYSYQWNKNGNAVAGATGSSYLFSGSSDADISVTVFANQCAATSATTHIIRNEKPEAVITPQGSPDICATGSVKLQCNDGNYTYNWYRNNSAIAGATKSSYTATSTGNYKVEVTSVTTGCTKNSPVVEVTSSCKEGRELSSSGFTIAPNPNSGTFTIITKPDFNIVWIRDLSGNVLWEHAYDAKKTGESLNVSLPPEIQNGAYLVTVDDLPSYLMVISR